MTGIILIAFPDRVTRIHFGPIVPAGVSGNLYFVAVAHMLWAPGIRPGTWMVSVPRPSIQMLRVVEDEVTLPNTRFGRASIRCTNLLKRFDAFPHGSALPPYTEGVLPTACQGRHTLPKLHHMLAILSLSC